MKIAVIPARGGSKRIPRKNIKPFCGKPMISWSIEAALASECFDQIIVSTDDAEIASVAKALGAQTPFTRPAELSSDFATTGAVMKHAVEWLGRATHVALDAVCCIYATAPFVRPSDLRSGLDLLMGANADYAFSVTTFEYPIQRALRIGVDDRLQMIRPEHYQTRSQDLEVALHDAGQFYWGSSEAWLHEHPIFSSASVPLVLPRYRVQDIDTEEDWIQAELLFRHLKERER